MFLFFFLPFFVSLYLTFLITGDGIISAIDLYVNMDVVKGTQGEDRFVITFDGKYLPHVEQLQSNNTAVTGTQPLILHTLSSHTLSSHTLLSYHTPSHFRSKTWY